jgi:predicted TIM-barrel fold metal-dependent hydrolase
VQDSSELRIVDIDQHYYEPDDCCTRHVEAEFADRVPAPRVTASGEREWHIGGRPVGFERWVRDVTLAPGAMHAATTVDGTRARGGIAMVDTRVPEYRDRATRLTLLDGWGIDAAVMLPTFGLAWDAEMTGDPEAACATARAFNRWIEDDWGYEYEGRLFAPPFVSLLDVGESVRELERVLGLGARMVLVRTGPVNGRSPADPQFDPFWARVEEAGIPVALHISTSGYEAALSQLWGEDPHASHRTFTGFQWFVAFATRPITDTLAALVFHNLFGRFPRLRIVSIENGSLWVEPLLRDLDLAWRFVAGREDDAAWLGGRIDGPPSAILRRHLYVAPYLTPGYDASIPSLVDVLGAEHVVFGSDWPHGEGRATPLDYDADFAPLDASTRHQVMATNTASLLGL